VAEFLTSTLKRGPEDGTGTHQSLARALRAALVRVAAASGGAAALVGVAAASVGAAAAAELRKRKALGTAFHWQFGWASPLGCQS